MGKKFLRGLGYFFCTILIILCIIMIIATAAFGSRKTVDVFGYNIYIVETDGFKSAPKGSAVLVKKCAAMELVQGNLVLWNNDSQPALGYVRKITLSDGVYSFNLDENGRDVVVAESQIIGHAKFSSVFLGQAVTFIKSPIGVFCIAVLPCVSLILFDIIRAIAKSRPELEVEPQFKNVPPKKSFDQQYGAQNRTIGVNSDGKASYKRKTTANSASADSVLFEPRKAMANPSKINSGALPKSSTVKSEPTAEPKNKAPRSMAIGAYSAISENKKPDPLVTAPVKDKTAEIPDVLSREPNDAFFVQTSVAAGRQKRSAPQIGKPAGGTERAGESNAKSTPTTVSRRKSSQILASKNIDDLISDDDDDRRSLSRISNDVVDDILADITKNGKK